MNTLYDIIIIGGGPIGLACGLEARKAGLSHLILEKGCLVNSLYNYPTNMTFFSTSELIEIGGVPFVSNNAKPVRAEALEYYRRVAVSNRLNLHLQEEVKSIHRRNGDNGNNEGNVNNEENGDSEENGDNKENKGKNGNRENEEAWKKGKFEVTSSRQQYLAGHVIIATGFYDIPVLLNIPGERLPKVTHYYKEPHYYALEKVVVVGASNSSVDAALETWRKGAEVTMVIRGEGIGPRVKYWVKPDIENRIREGSIRALTLSTLQAIREKEVDILTPDGLITVPNDYVIALTGYQPDFNFLRKAKIRLSEDENLLPAYDPATMETNIKNLYLAGVVCGGMNTHKWFIENSREHAALIVKHITGKQRPPTI